MSPNPRLPVYIGIICWTLLALWTGFAVFEFAEFAQMIEGPEESMDLPDLDFEALMKLASGIKSHLPGLPTLSTALVLFIAIILILASRPSGIAGPTVQQAGWLRIHSTPSLPLFQQHAIYRI